MISSDSSTERRIPDSKVDGTNMGPICVLSAPDGPHVGPRNLAFRDNTCYRKCHYLERSMWYKHRIIFRRLSVLFQFQSTNVVYNYLGSLKIETCLDAYFVVTGSTASYYYMTTCSATSDHKVGTRSTLASKRLLHCLHYPSQWPRSMSP